MEIKEIVSIIRDQGSISLADSAGEKVTLINPQAYQSETTGGRGVFLLVDLFQIRGIAGQFSEVSLDIVEYTSKPTVYTTWASELLKTGPVNEGKVKFSVLKKGIWNQIVFAFGRPLVASLIPDQETSDKLNENFPLYSKEVRQLFLGPEGEVKIIEE